MKPTPKNLSSGLAQAIASFWIARKLQREKQAVSGRKDQGARGAATGGAQMDAIITLLADLLLDVGVEAATIHQKRALELPGFFRPTKEWDLLVIRDDQLIIAVEAKSHVGPSFGNNFNNRTEEAMGSSLDLWTAYREGAFNRNVKPWLGYLLLLEDCPASRRPVKTREPHFEVFPEFKKASYARRYELFCRKLVRERHYSAATFLTSEQDGGLDGEYSEPSDELSFDSFARSLCAQALAFGKES
jgi:hypothetical protein